MSSAIHIQCCSLYLLAHRTTLASAKEHFQSQRMSIFTNPSSLLSQILPPISNNISLLTVSSSMAARALRSCPIYAHAFPAMTSPPSGPKLSRYAFLPALTPFLVPCSTFCPSINFSYALFLFYFTSLSSVTSLSYISCPIRRVYYWTSLSIFAIHTILN